MDFDAAMVEGTARIGVRLEFEAGRVARVLSVPPPGRGHVALPGFCNVHAHLDLSFLRGEDLDHSSFADWVRGLVAGRRDATKERLRQAVREGAAELLATGTVAVGDIDSTGASLAALRETSLEGISFREVLGRPDAGTLGRWLEERTAGPHDRVRSGLSPHAPYSTPESVFQEAFKLAGERDLPVTSHLAETLEERELLQRDGGPLRELFDEWGFPRPLWSDPGAGLLQRVLRLGPPGARFLAVHGNHLGTGEAEALARSGAGLAYCPRSHAYFGHPRPHPAGALLRLGVPVALGTDSRASNGGLDMWQEMVCWRQADPSVTDPEIFAAATRTGREVLGLEPADLGEGHPATFQVARDRDGASLDLENLLSQAVRGRLETVTTVVDGRVVGGREA